MVVSVTSQKYAFFNDLTSVFKVIETFLSTYVLDLQQLRSPIDPDHMTTVGEDMLIPVCSYIYLSILFDFEFTEELVMNGIIPKINRTNYSSFFSINRGKISL